MTDQTTIPDNRDGSTAAAGVFTVALRKRFSYDPVTGDLVRNFGTKLRGTPVTAVAGNGYKVANFQGRQYGVHRLVWAYHYGALPTCVLDHINRNRLDNRIENLREGGWELNNHNRSLSIKNSLGFKGIKKCPSGRWGAQINHKGKWHWLGRFDSKEDAARAFDARAIELFGPDATTNETLGNFRRAA